MTSAWRGRFILLAACLVLAACIARGTRPEAPRPPSGLQFIGRNSRGFGEYVNPQDGSVLVRIPAGPFIMGSQARDEGPRHRVYLPAFFMARCEVTNVQFATFTRATGYRATSDWQTCAARSGDLAPVTMVSWWDAVEYCRWAGLRLASEAEWEKAARGSDGRRFPWGNEWDGSRLVWAGTAPSHPLPVGSRPSGASPYGCMDTAGNVLEWTASLYGSYPYPPQGREEPSLAGCRVVRGGSYGGGRPELFGCSVRLMIQPAVAVEVKGFRVARSCP